jgi:hypothetical protein
MEWVASTLHTKSEHGVSSITTADAHTSTASSWLNWRPLRFKWTHTFRRKTKSDFCACAITFQTQYTDSVCSGIRCCVVRDGLLNRYIYWSKNNGYVSLKVRKNLLRFCTDVNVKQFSFVFCGRFYDLRRQSNCRWFGGTFVCYVNESQIRNKLMAQTRRSWWCTQTCQWRNRTPFGSPHAFLCPQLDLGPKIGLWTRKSI